MTDKTYTSRKDTDAVVQDWDGMIIGPDYIEEWEAYQLWLSEGNVPNPYVEEIVYQPTTQEKMAAAGLSVDELKTLLGLK